MSNSEELLNRIATSHLDSQIKSEFYDFLKSEERKLCIDIDDAVESARQALIPIVHEAKVSFEDCHLMRLLITQAVQEVGYDASEPSFEEEESGYYSDE